MTPRVSVLMAVYNGERHLREAVDSILGQTFTDFEFIIIDDCSTDDTATILRTYRDARIVLLRNEINLGLTKSLNLGIASAQGIFIARQDADDISLPDRFSEQVRFLHEHPSVAAVGSWFERIDENGHGQGVVEHPTSGDIIRERLLYRNCLCHGSAVIRHQDLLAIGAYRAEIVLAQDWDLWLRLSERHELANLPRVLYRLRRNSASLSETQTDRQRKFGRQAVEEAMRRRLVGPIELRPTPETLARHFLFLAGDDIECGDRLAARSHLAQAFAAYPDLVQDANGILEDVVYRGVSRYVRRGAVAGATEHGASYLRHWFTELPSSAGHLAKQRREAIGWYYVALAFHHYQSGRRQAVPGCAVRGIWYAPKWLRNPGLLSIGVEALVGERAMRRLRTWGQWIRLKTWLSVLT